jgi:hypothetical protein
MKRPEQSEFWEQWEYFKGDKAALAEHYGCSLGSIYNWWHEFEDLKDEEKQEQLVENTLDISSDIEEEPDREFEYFVEKQEESPNQPHIREATIRIPDSCLIIMAADCHFGSIYTDVRLAKEVMDLCAKTENVYAFFNGDLVDYEGAGPPDIKYDQAFAHPNTTRAMAESWIRGFNGSMLMMLTGCHDNWVYRHTGETFPERLQKYIPTKAVFHDSIMLNLQVGDVMYRGHVGHKAGNGHSKYNPSHGLFHELRMDFTGDFVVAAHRHKAAIAMQFIRENIALAVNCGAFKKIDFYANKSFIQKPIRVPAVYFDAKEKKMVPFIDYKDGIRYVKALNACECREQITLGKIPLSRDEDPNT